MGCQSRGVTRKVRVWGEFTGKMDPNQMWCQIELIGWVVD